jgi:predicted metal-dependent hydrolase
MPDNATIAIAGQPHWAGVLPLPDGFRVVHYLTAKGLVARLTDDGAVLVLVDGGHPEWGRFAAAVKTSPATRRLAVMVVAVDAAVRAAAAGQGADLAITPDALIADFEELVARYARVPNEAETAQLASDCAGDLPPLALAGVEKFNNREFYPQHDLFEEQWMATAGPVRNLYRAILQVGVAYYQIERGNLRGAQKMLLRAVPWLEMLPDVCQGVDVAGLRRDAYHVRAVLADTAPEEIGAFDMTLLKPIRMVKP